MAERILVIVEDGKVAKIEANPDDARVQEIMQLHSMSMGEAALFEEPAPHKSEWSKVGIYEWAVLLVTPKE